MNLEFGKNLKMLRLSKDLTQDELAQKLSLSVQAISRYETGAAYPDIEMLPVIAGFFGVTVDALLGVSSEARDRRMEEYQNELNKITDRKERLALLRKEHAEFPQEWQIVSDMVYEMTFLPECLDEMREIVDDALKNCNDNLWRENMIIFYIESEPNEEIANAFIEKHASCYDMRKTELFDDRYYARGEQEKLKRVRQKKAYDELEHTLFRLTERISDDCYTSYENCSHVLSLINHFSNNPDVSQPDMWINVKLMIMIRLANNCFKLSKDDEGFSVLEDAVALFENFFSLKNGTVLTYGTPLFDKLSATTEKDVFYKITEFGDMFATSMMTTFIYQTPIGPVNESEKYVYDREGFKFKMIFSEHTANNLRKGSGWDGFAKVENDPRFISLCERAKAVSSIENINNLMFLMDGQINRTDDFIEGKKWFCALLVKGVGAYVIFDDADDIKEKFSRMRKEGNTLVYQVVAAEFGGNFIEPPEIIKKHLLELNKNNKNTQVILRYEKGEIKYTAI